MRAWRSWIGNKSLEFQTVLGAVIFAFVLFMITMVIGDQGWSATLAFSVVTATLVEVPMYIYAKRRVGCRRE